MAVKLKKLGLVLWGLVTVLLATTFIMEYQLNTLLREKVALMQKSERLLVRYCDGMERVNKLCEAQVVTVFERLGLDTQAVLPLITTAVVQRATGEYPALQPKEQVAKVPENKEVGWPVVGGPLAIGGPLE